MFFIKSLFEKKKTSTFMSNQVLLSDSLTKNLDKLESEFGDSSDLSFRKVNINTELQIAVAYIEGISDEKTVNGYLKLVTDKLLDQEKLLLINPIECIQRIAISFGKVQLTKDLNSIIFALLSGNTIILAEGTNESLILDSVGDENRAITEPTTQSVIRGPKDSFIESIRTNTMLVRRRIKSSNLRVELMRVGEVTHTDVAIMYIKGIADDKVFDEVKNRIGNINVDAIFESGNIEELIQDHKLSLFPTALNTERPDEVASNLIEGKVAIFIDGTPFVLVVPTTFSQLLKSPEDFYQKFYVATFVRLLRYFAFFITIFASPIYIAATTYHQEIIPTTLLISLASQREGVPFPAFFEALIMEITFEFIREAGIRMPRSVGQAVSIVGALVLGEAAVSAGLVSPAMVIVVATTAICSFTIPSFNLAISIRLLKFLFMISAATFGIYGIAVGVIMIIAHLCHLKSFGTPYLSPFSPLVVRNQEDAILRLPKQNRSKRDKTTSKLD